jgi:peptidyl-prolyl cis-trans isomerase D
MAAGMKHLSKTFVWILMGMLIVGLAGFGAVNFTGNASSVASAGSQDITVEEYARELQREQQSLQQQTGQAMPIQQMITFGLDRAVLSRLVATAALDSEVEAMGISIGDEVLLDEITKIDAFHNAAGEFDRDSYRFALDRVGLSERDFEEDARRETARILVQAAVMAGAEMPATLADTLTGYIGARRSFDWVQLKTEETAMIALAPTEQELQDFYDANPDLFTLPETRKITYAVLSPDMVMDEVQVDEDALRALYEDRAAQYQVPERRLVERLAFGNEEEAAAAKARLDAGEVTFAELVDERGLELADIDLGDMTAEGLGAAAEGVFAAHAGMVTGPLPSDVGPALYRINGILSAQNTTFEEAEAELRDEIAAGRARRLIEGQSEDIDDLLAGGATLEELTDEAGLKVDTIEWTADSDEGIAAYSAFRDAAAAVSEDDFPAVDFLEDGSLFALRLDEVLAERPEPLEDAQDKALRGWNDEQRLNALATQAQSIKTRAEASGSFDEDLAVTAEEGLTRTAYLDGTPADMMTQLFEMEPGELRVVSDADSAVILRLNEVLEPLESAEMTAMQEAIAAQLNQQLAEALFQAFARDAQLRAQPTVNEQAINAVHASFQ